MHKIERQAGYRRIGPQRRDEAIVYDRLPEVWALPRAAHVCQVPGSFPVTPGEAPSRFARASGPSALVPILFVPLEPLWRVQRTMPAALKVRRDDAC